MKKIPVNPNSQPESAHCMCFTTDNSRLITVTSSSQLQICSIEDGTISAEFTFPEKSGLYLFSEIFILQSDNRIFNFSWWTPFDKSSADQFCKQCEIRRICWTLLNFLTLLLILYQYYISNRAIDKGHFACSKSLFDPLTLCCGYSKESSQRDGSFEYPQHRVCFNNKREIAPSFSGPLFKFSRN